MRPSLDLVVLGTGAAASEAAHACREVGGEVVVVDRRPMRFKRTFRHAAFTLSKMASRDDDKDVHHRAMVYTRQGSQDYGITGYEKEQVIANLMHEYDRQLRWQKPTRRGS